MVSFEEINKKKRLPETNSVKGTTFEDSRTDLVYCGKTCQV